MDWVLIGFIVLFVIGLLFLVVWSAMVLAKREDKRNEQHIAAVKIRKQEFAQRD
jgi:heme/copper-type cytochrome/quinol oxidase subunit 2